VGLRRSGGARRSAKQAGQLRRTPPPARHAGASRPKPRGTRPCRRVPSFSAREGACLPATRLTLQVRHAVLHRSRPFFRPVRTPRRKVTLKLSQRHRQQWRAVAVLLSAVLCRKPASPAAPRVPGRTSPPRAGRRSANGRFAHAAWLNGGRFAGVRDAAAPKAW